MAKQHPGKNGNHRHDAERYFVQGPHSRWRELGFTLGVVREFIRGFRALHFLPPCVTVFGSARFQEDHPHYLLAREMGHALSRMGFTVMTGGGPGIMEAANRGAKDAGGFSVGCNIHLPKEQKPNAYLDRTVTLHHFFVRKVLLLKYSYAFVVMPGGFGTMDEFFETLTLIQTGKISDFPVVLMGKDYWKPLLDLLHQMVREGTAAQKDLEHLIVTDEPGQALAHIRKHAIDEFGLSRFRRPRAFRFFGERRFRFR